MKRKVIDLVAPTKATPRKEPSPSLDDNFCEALCPQGKPRYECNVCGKQMQRSSNAKMAHILGQDVKGTRVEACKFPPHPDLKKSLLAEVKGAPERRNPWESASISKLDAETAKRNADTAVLKFITTNDIAPLVVESASMRELAVALRQAPPTYVLPSRKQLGMDGGELGSLLESTLIEMRKRKLEALQQVQYIGGTLCSDGAKNRKRLALNSTLITAIGAFYVQSTDATGKHKTADYLYEDIKSAISQIGYENVFIVCMDGACKATLRKISDRMPKIFPQRCSTHACNLLMKDIGSFFMWEMEWCVRIVKFVCNHEAIYSILRNNNDAKGLVGFCEVRFASMLYSVERIVQDAAPLRCLWVDPELLNFLGKRAKPEVRAEHKAIEQAVIFSDVAWKRLNLFCDVLTPIRVMLRITDSNTPNLHILKYAFDDARKQSVAAAEEAAKDATLNSLHLNLKSKVEAAFNKRRSDIVTRTALAASVLYPKVVDSNHASEDTECHEAVLWAIEKYFKEEPDRLAAAINDYTCYREKSGRYFSAGSSGPHILQTEGVDAFWRSAGAYHRNGAELFRKFCNAFAGQGEAERMNKAVKATRSIKRNRQGHKVTSAYMELKNCYRVVDDSSSASARKVKEQKYIDIIVERLAAKMQASESSDSDTEVDLESPDPDDPRTLTQAAANSAGDDTDEDAEESDEDELIEKLLSKNT